MLQLLRLLLYLAAGAVFYVPGTQATYFESAPACGYAATGFIHFEQTRQLNEYKTEQSLGVCGWGFLDKPALRPQVKTCVSCSFTPADKPSCPKGATKVSFPVWYLAPERECEWQGCYGECLNGTVKAWTLCDNGLSNVQCCRYRPYIRCCSAVDCIWRSNPAGRCVVDALDLLPGQQYAGPVFAVSAATDCNLYSFNSSRVCRTDRTFAPEQLYDSCETRAVSVDTEGCAKLPGYTFHPGFLVKDSYNWRVDDGTPWSQLQNAAAVQQAAARDMLLMASRCSALDTCVGFQNTGSSTDLLYQLPTSGTWARVEDQTPEARCYGIYEKTPAPSSCSRVSGYLFIPLHTPDLNTAAAAGLGFVATAGSGPCSTCANSTQLAAQCNSSASCVGFSNYHGLLARNTNTNNSFSTTSTNYLLSDSPLTQFTRNPCVGTFVRTSGAFPAEVEQLDRLLCGELVYCASSQLRYHAASQSSTSGNYYVDLTVDIYTDLALPRGIADATAAGGLLSLPSVRSLTFRCHDGAALLGGLPAGLAALTPFLQELRVVGCRATGPLPAALAALRYLRVLDLGDNSLGGTLPAAWGNMTLGYLNLSRNALSGALPTAWRRIITPSAAAAALPPPPPAAAPLPPPLSIAAAAAGRRRSTRRATQAVATTLLPPLAEMLTADLSSNVLEGPVDRGFVYDSCVRRELRMQLRGDPGEMLAAGMGGLPTMLLQYNPGIAVWAGGYSVADLGSGSGSSNLCGAVGYKIALGVLWGVFGACFLTICTSNGVAAWKSARASRRGRFFIKDVGGPSPKASPGDAGEAAGGGGCVSPTASGAKAGVVALASRAAAAARGLWRRRWFRRVTLLLRIGYLAADVALDIRVTVWLFAAGEATAAAVCLAFLLASQAAVSAAVVASLAHHLFASRLVVVAVAPLLLAMGPVVGPVLAMANTRNSDVPLVFWRYLELVEFCVALLQAPAQSVAQSVVYARLNELGNGMYMHHGLFVASIVLSLGDMLVAAVKLCRYKRGPLRRVLVALTHLDRVRDPVDYQKPLLSAGAYDDCGTDGGGSRNSSSSRGGAGYVPHYLETPLNPPAGSRGAAARQAPGLDANSGGGVHGLPRQDAGPLPVSPPGGSGGDAAVGGDAASTPILELSPREEWTTAGPSPRDEDGQSSAAAAVAVAVASAHTFTPLTAPRYRPSLLATSSQRLGGGSGHAMGLPSRLGPAGALRALHTSGGALTITAHPPLRPSLAHLPLTPSSAARSAGGGGGSEPFAAPQARAWAAAEVAELEAANADGAAASTETAKSAVSAAGSLNRKSRSLQTPVPSQSFESQPGLAGSISSEVYGAAATGGHWPPEAQEIARPKSGSGGAPAAAPGRAMPSEDPSGSSGGDISSPAAAAAELQPPSPSSDPRHLPSAAAAAHGALTGRVAGPPPTTPPMAAHLSFGRGSTPAAPSSSSSPPERLVLVPPPQGGTGPGPSGQAGGSAVAGVPLPAPRALRHVSSAGGSPARRREVPSLSITVPVSPVQSLGIEVIRMSTPSARHPSPQSSGRSAPTPVVLPPPPPQLQAVLQRERRERQQQHLQKEQEGQEPPPQQQQQG